MKVYGQLELAQMEVVSADPALLPVGRFLFNKTDGYAKIADEGNVLTKFLLNDDKIIIGTSGTAANNIRLNRAGAGILQLVLGSDVTAEGSISATPAKLSACIESYINASLPTVGNVGRLAFVTDQSTLKIDDGSVWRTILTEDGTIFDAHSRKISNVVDPVLAQDVATKNYVDTGGAINKNGTVTFLANQSMGGFKLTNVQDPTVAQDAATKNYVDSTSGNPFQAFTSLQVGTSSASLTSASFVNFSNSPFFSFTPTVSGNYKVYTSAPIDGLQSAVNAIRIKDSLGAPTLLYESQAVRFSQSSGVTSTQVIVSLYTQSVYTLTAGVTYAFDIQGKVSNGTSTLLRGDISPFYMFAERVG